MSCYKYLICITNQVSTFTGVKKVNLSKSRRNSPQWRRWANAGAVDYTLRARKMGAAIFGYDPLIGCPFDDSEMKMVEENGELKVGRHASFRGLNYIGTMIFPTVRGRIIAIGENAKYLNGDPFIALAIQVGSNVYFKTDKDVRVHYDVHLLKKEGEGVGASVSFEFEGSYAGNLSFQEGGVWQVNDSSRAEYILNWAVFEEALQKVRKAYPKG